MPPAVVRRSAAQKALAMAMAKAVISENLPALRRHIDNEEDLELAEGSGWTPLILAAWYGQLDMLRLLLDAGASMAAIDRNDWSAYHHACYGGHTRCTELLIEKGVDVAAIQSDGKTGRDMAIAEKHEKLVEMLVEQGVPDRDAPAEGTMPASGAGASSAKKRKQLADKGLVGPKRPLSAYMFFMKAKRDGILEEQPELSTSATAAAKAIGALWRVATPDERAPYAAQAAEDKERYKRELEALPEDQRPKPKEKPPKKPRKIRPPKEPKQPKQPRQPKQKKAPRPKPPSGPPKPKGALTAYMYFVKAKRTELLAEDPRLSVTETAKATGQEWRNLTDEEKAPFDKLSTDDKARNAREMVVYMAAGGSVSGGGAGGQSEERATSLPLPNHAASLGGGAVPARPLLFDGAAAASGAAAGEGAGAGGAARGRRKRPAAVEEEPSWSFSRATGHRTGVGSSVASSGVHHGNAAVRPAPSAAEARRLARRPTLTTTAAPETAAPAAAARAAKRAKGSRSTAQPFTQAPSDSEDNEYDEFAAEDAAKEQKKKTEKTKKKKETQAAVGKKRVGKKRKAKAKEGKKRKNSKETSLLPSTGGGFVLKMVDFL